MVRPRYGLFRAKRCFADAFGKRRGRNSAQTDVLPACSVGCAEERPNIVLTSHILDDKDPRAVCHDLRGGSVLLTLFRLAHDFARPGAKEGTALDAVDDCPSLIRLNWLRRITIDT